MVLPGEARDQHRLGPVGFVALPLTAPKRLALRRVDNPHDLSDLGQKEGARVAISAGGFHHGVDVRRTLFGEPGRQGLTARRRIQELVLVVVPGVGITHQGDVKGLFTKVNAKFGNPHCAAPREGRHVRGRTYQARSCECRRVPGGQRQEIPSGLAA